MRPIWWIRKHEKTRRELRDVVRFDLLYPWVFLPIEIDPDYHGYAHNGLSAECRANRHQDCVDGGCVCACHGAEDE